MSILNTIEGILKDNVDLDKNIDKLVSLTIEFMATDIKYSSISKEELLSRLNKVIHAPDILVIVSF